MIPTYNGVKTIVRAVASAQSAADVLPLEIIVVDDGSEDDTVELVRQLFSNDVNLVRQPNAGRSAARNSGAKLSRCEYLLFLDDDDTIVVDGARAISAAVTGAPPRPNLVRLGVRFIKCSADVLDRVLLPTRDIFDGPFIPGSFAIQRSLFVRLGGYDEKLDYAENTDLLIRVALEDPEGERSTTISAVGVDHLHRSDVATHYAEARLAATLYLLEKHREALRERPRIQANFLGVAAHDLYKSGRPRAALRLAVKSFAAQPRLRSLARIGRIVTIGQFQRLGTNHEDHHCESRGR